MNEEFIWWPAICHQFKIEFGIEMETRFGGNIANLMYSIHALVDKASHAPSDAAAQPTVVCLCGSTRFYDYFMRANYEETMAGRIVLSVGFYPHAQKQMHHEEVGCTSEQKRALDELHKRKIDLCDEIFVLNVGGYIGSSTRSEIDYAIAHGKPIRYLEPIIVSTLAEIEHNDH